MTAPTTGHTIRLLKPEEIAEYAEAGWTLCARDGCKHPHVYYVTRRSSYGQTVRERLCTGHGTGFARRHKLAAPPAPREALTVTSGKTTHEVCPDCRHWLGRTELEPGRCVPDCACAATCHTAAVPA